MPNWLGDRADAAADLIDERGRRALQPVLRSNEVLLVVRNKHWASMIPTAAAFLAGLFFMLAVVAGGNAGQSNVAIWLFVILAAICAYRTIEWRHDWFVVTNRRMLRKHGFIGINQPMMPLTKVTDMAYRQSATGRVLGYGKFDLESAGQDQALRYIEFVPNSERIYNLICEEIFDDEGYEVDERDDRDDTPPYGIPIGDPDDPDEPVHRLGGYLERPERARRTPLRQRILRGPQPVEQHRWSEEVQQANPSWSVSHEDASPHQSVRGQRRRRPNDGT